MNTVSLRPGRGKRVRGRQRAAHLVAGAVLVIYVYVAPVLGSGPTAVVQWVVVPVLVVSGLALWQWHRLRGRLNRARGRVNAA